MTDSLETPESMAEPWKPSATAVPQRVGKRPAPFTTVLVLTVEHSKPINALAALIESRISSMDGVLDVSSRPHSAEATQPTQAEAPSETEIYRAWDEAGSPCPLPVFSSIYKTVWALATRAALATQPTQAEAPSEREAKGLPDPLPLPPMRASIYVHPQLGELWDRLSVQLYAMGYADDSVRAALATQQAVQRDPLWPVDGVYPDMQPPATSHDRWMFDQGRLAERRIAQQAVQAEPVGYYFHRFVDGTKMAEDVEVTQAKSLDEAVAIAARICPQRPMTVLVLATPPAPGQVERAVEALRKIKLRICFMNWPAESFWNAGTADKPHWVPDWRYEAQLIDNVLHGTPITTPEKPTDTVPFNQLPKTPGQGERDREDAERWRMLPAFIEDHQIDYVKLLRDIDAARSSEGGGT